jgi:hypothetical protein
MAASKRLHAIAWLGLCSWACGTSPDVPIPDAGPPRVEILYGDPYTPETTWSFLLDNGNLGIDSTFDAFPEPWLTTLVLARFDNASGTYESLENTTTHLTVTAGEEVVAEGWLEMSVALDHLQRPNAYGEMQLSLCDPRIRFPSANLFMTAVVNNGDQVVASHSIGPVYVRCAPECLSVCDP